MNKRVALVLSLVGFAALVHPCRSLVGIVDTIGLVMFARMPSMELGAPFGPFGRVLGRVAIELLLAAGVAAWLYRRLRGCGFDQVCTACARHRGRVGVLLGLVVLFNVVRVEPMSVPVLEDDPRFRQAQMEYLERLRVERQQAVERGYLERIRREGTGGWEEEWGPDPLEGEEGNGDAAD